MTWNPFQKKPTGTAVDEQGTAVEINQHALVNILTRYPGPFDVFRELIQNADDAEAQTVEIRFETEDNPSSSVDLNQIKVCKWIIENDGHPLEKEDWRRLRKIAEGNRNSSKVGAFGVGFYIVLSVCDKPRITSNGRFLQMTRDKEKKELRVKTGHYKADPQSTNMTSIELVLKPDVHEPLPKLTDLARFLISSITFLDKIQTISVFLDDHPLLCIKKKTEDLPSIENPDKISGMLIIKSICHAVQCVTVEAVEQAFPKPKESSIDEYDDEDDQVASIPDNPQASSTYSLLCDLSHKSTFTVTYDLYIAQVRANPPSEVKEGVASVVKALPEQFPCKVVYFSSEQHNAVVESKTSHFFQGSHGILQDNNGRIFIGQSTRQTTGIGLHIGSHFLPTVERGTVDLINGQVAVWNVAVFNLAGHLARVVYEQEMMKAEKAGPDQARIGLYTMGRFAFEGRADDGVLQHLKDGFFFSPSMRVLSTTGISNVTKVRKPNAQLSFLQSHPFLSNDLSPRHRTLLIERCGIPKISLQDLVDEFANGVSEDQMLAFFRWWKTSETEFKNKEGLFEQLRSKGKLHFRGEEMMVKNIKQYTLVTLDKELLPPGTLYISDSLAPVLDQLYLLGWAQLTMLSWLEHCRQLLQADDDTQHKESVGQRIFTVLTGPRGILCLTEQDRDKAKKLLDPVECIRTDRGMKRPSECYFAAFGVFEEVPVVDDNGLSREMRVALEHLGIHRRVDWDTLMGSKVDCSADTNARLLRYLMDVEDTVMLDNHIKDLRRRKMFASEQHGQLIPTELHRPDVFDGKLRELGLPIFDLGATELLDAASAEILERLGVRTCPALQKIVEWLSKPAAEEIRTIARECLRLNKEGYRKEVETESRDAFIPTIIPGKYASLRSVARSPSWEKLGFDLISDSLQGERSLLEVLGIEDDPSPDVIIDILKGSPPNIETIQTWLEQLELHRHRGKLHDLSEIPFVPVQIDSTHKAPKDCFVVSPEDMSSHLVRVFPIVDFGEQGNQFLLYCDARDGLPEALDVANEMAENPTRYLERLGYDYDCYCSDLRDVAAKYDSTFFRSFRHDMRKHPMLLAKQTENNIHELRSAVNILIGGDKENLSDFGSPTFMAPQGLELLYKKLGSKDLDAYVEYIDRIYPLQGSDSSPLPLSRDEILHCIERFTSDEQVKGRQSGISIYDLRRKDKIEVKLCSELELQKKYVPPRNHLAEGKSYILAPTRPVAAICKSDLKNGSHTLYIAKNHKSDLITDIARALCRLLVQTHRHRDLLMMKKFLQERKDDKPCGEKVTPVPESPDASDTSEAPRPKPKKKGKKKRSSEEIGNNPREQHASTSARVNPIVHGLEFDPVQWAKDAIRLCPDGSKTNQELRSIPDQGKKDAHCKRVTLESKPDDKLEKLGIKFFWEKNSRSRKLDEGAEDALNKFAELVQELARVFQVDPSKTFSIFWKDKEEHLMGFNDQGHIFLNLAYFKHHYMAIASEDRAVTDWYFILAHEIAHNTSPHHCGVHETAFAGICVRYLNALYKHYPSCKKYLWSK